MTPGLMAKFQGVVCSSLIGQDANNDLLAPSFSYFDSIREILDIKTTSIHHEIPCYNLELKNKYYETTVHLFDYDKLTEDDDDDQRTTPNLLESCEAIILYCDGQKITTEQLDKRIELLNSVGGEPRILLCHGIDEDCEPYKTLLSWSIQNGYNFLLTQDETIKTQLIDTLSAHRWTHRSGASRVTDTLPQQQQQQSASGDTNSLGNHNDEPKLNDEMMKKLMDFDSLLGKLSAYRDRPELRGNPDDKNIEEIAEILSGLLGDDVDNFLDGDLSNVVANDIEHRPSTDKAS